MTLHSHHWEKGVPIWFCAQLPWIHWLTPEDILFEDRPPSRVQNSSTCLEVHQEGGMVCFTNCHFKSLWTFFFLVESKNNHTKMEIPILIQGFYKFLCMFRWRWPSLSHILSMLFKKQNELVRLCIIYWCSNCSSLKFTEDFGWPTSK